MANAYPSHTHEGPEPGGPGDSGALDAANQSLADALRKSFWVLKVLMGVLVVLYVLSGWFSVKTNEVGIVTRFGKVAGGGVGGAVLRPGWHWSWPYPIERWHTVSTAERELPIKFIEFRTEKEQISGKLEYKYNDRLSPDRDDYLLTGDVNILHSLLKVKYRITDPLAYLNYVSPMPRPEAAVTGPPNEHFPEYSILTNLVRDAVIETAAGWVALEVRGSRQSEFLGEVAQCVNRKLGELKAAGTPLGINVNPMTGIVAPKTSGNEGVYPPRQVQQVFDEVFAVQTKKAKAIAKANAEAEEMLTQAAGPTHPSVSRAINDEFEALLALSKAESDVTADDREIADLRSALVKKRADVENMLESASGQVRTILKQSQLYKDAVVKEVISDKKKLEAMLPEYRRNPELLLSRLSDEYYAEALDSKKLTKWWLPRTKEQYRLIIQESPRKPEDAGKKDVTLRNKVTIDLDETDIKNLSPSFKAKRVE